MNGTDRLRQHAHQPRPWLHAASGRRRRPELDPRPSAKHYLRSALSREPGRINAKTAQSPLGTGTVQPRLHGGYRRRESPSQQTVRGTKTNRAATSAGTTTREPPTLQACHQLISLHRRTTPTATTGPRSPSRSRKPTCRLHKARERATLTAEVSLSTQHQQPSSHTGCEPDLSDAEPALVRPRTCMGQLRRAHSWAPGHLVGTQPIGAVTVARSSRPHHDAPWHWHASSVSFCL
jgi:hypothetical protein